jgi:predicted DNA-binding transcriptional regulator AlpA
LKLQHDEAYRLFVEALLDEKDVARATRMSLATIRRWRLQRTGPRWIKVGGTAVRYRAADLARWIDSLPGGGGSEDRP